MNAMRQLVLALLLQTSALLVLAADTPLAPADPKAAFAQLQALAGEWKGGIGQPDGAPGRMNYRVTAGGHTVMETMFPGTDHEMISMYHLDGKDLVLTHYCAAGNQPKMKLSAEKSTATELVFEFDGGSNLDAAKDGHIHCGRIRLPEPNRLEADWVFYAGGKSAGTNRFFLSRKPN
jgi:hypothetical protein